MDTNSSAYQLLELTALSGECSPNVLTHLNISQSYVEKLITRLKSEKYLKTHYKDQLRGYRLTAAGKKFLLSINPERFSFYLTGSCDTNQPRSDYPRRLRLQQASICYVLFLNAGIQIFRDKKPPLFQEHIREPCSIVPPVFYHSREIKELGAETVKINNSRCIGILLAAKCIYTVFYTGDSLMKWEYRTELKVKALLAYHASQGILSKGKLAPCYHQDTPIRALMIGKGMDTALKLLTSTGGFQKSYFYLDTSFDYFHYVPDSKEGEVLLKLLCSPQLMTELRGLLLSDLQPPSTDFGLEHDAVSDDLPVLLAYDFDLLRLSHYHTALSLHSLYGNLICFDFQKEVLQHYFKDSVTITTIDLEKFERRFLS